MRQVRHIAGTGDIRNTYKIFVGKKVKGMKQLRNVEVQGRIILKQFLEK
jgi:hypothetical protein